MEGLWQRARLALVSETVTIVVDAVAFAVVALGWRLRQLQAADISLVAKLARRAWSSGRSSIGTCLFTTVKSVEVVRVVVMTVVVLFTC